jgi:hypothetical protein
MAPVEANGISDASGSVIGRRMDHLCRRFRL